ncbi:hypothetical protein U1Q18_049373, partial [Sarracenia purpurea var. burkii]
SISITIGGKDDGDGGQTKGWMGNFVIIFGDPAFFCSCTLSLLANGYYAALNCHAGWSNHIEDTFFIKAVSNPNEMSKR